MKYSIAIIALAVFVEANPVALPQAVTAAISPPQPAPSGCSSVLAGSFGIGVHKVAPTAAPVKREVVEEICDERTRVYVMAPVSQIGDGQMQGGQATMTVTKPCPATPTPAPQPATPVAKPAPAVKPAQNEPAPAKEPTPSKEPSPVVEPAPVEKLTSEAPPTPTPEVPARVVTSSSSTTDVAAASTPKSGMKACAKDGALAITLENGILKDQKGRTGYIAANYQFQFDGPPQAGALYTSGFTVCNNGSIALGGSSIFYQCLSGDFYNLYDRYWAAQCSPVTMNTIMLEKC